MKLSLRIISGALFVLSVMSAFSLVSCQQKNEGETAKLPEIPGEESPYIDNLPETLDLGGETIRFAADTHIGNMTVRSLVCEEISGDIVDASIYKRNNLIKARFNVDFKVVKTAEITDLPDVIRQSVLSYSDDYDIVAGTQFHLARLATEGLMMNLSGLPNLDLTREYWSQRMTQGMSYKGATYWCTGDLALRYIGGMYVTFINKTIWEDYFPDDDYYQMALDGEWTLDKMNEMAAQVYEDLNNNDQKDWEDKLGCIVNIHDDMNEALYTASGITFSKTGIDGVPYMDYDLEKIIGFCEKATEFTYQNPGVCQKDILVDEIVQKFAAGNVLALTTRLYMSEIHLRNMKDDFAVLPMPKYDLEQKGYITAVHDGTTIFGIPITNTKTDITTTVLEAMAAESYRVVTPVWYEMALKLKYVRDDMSAQMIDMIREGIVGDFVFYYHIGGENAQEESITHFFRHLIYGNTDFASQIASVKDMWEIDMQDVLDKLEKYSR